MASAAEQLAANLNLGAFSKATELKKRIWFTLGALIVYRLGTYIPMPGIDPIALAEVFKQNQRGILGLFDVFAGGAIGRMTIFALNIMPYISASIIMQLMTTVSPQLEQLKKEGEAGRKKMNQYTRYGTVFLTALQAYGIAAGLTHAAKDGVRLLGRGKLTAAVTIEVAGASRSAEEAVKAAGGSITLLVPRKSEQPKRAPKGQRNKRKIGKAKKKAGGEDE